MWIIKEGKLPDAMQGRCVHCGAEVGCSKTEARHDPYAYGAYGGRWQVPCPTPSCNRMIDLADAPTPTQG